ncbi:MAG: TetR/AcrR family transcriptional regulator [Campylobacteraceae bacterium]|nr:TetR/AcrR family transcriptional regulator [Campylobacteraceae bacterium]
MGKCIIEYIKDKCNKKTQNYHHGNLKEELLKESLKIIQDKGIESLTLQVLATQLGTSRSAIYRHFSSKNDLINNVMMYGFDKFGKSIAPILAKKDLSVMQRLKKMGQAYINFASTYPNLYRILFGEKLKDVREENCEPECEDQKNGFNSLIELLQEGQDTNVIKKDDVLLQAQAIHSLIHGLSSLSIDGHIQIKENINSLFEYTFDTFIEGLSI